MRYLTWAVLAVSISVCGQDYSIKIPGVQKLRVYGQVNRTINSYGQGSKNVTENVFECGSSKSAAAIAGKFISDLKLSAGVEELTVGKNKIFKTAAGKAFVIVLEGTCCRIISSESFDSLKSFITKELQTVDKADYPLFIDRFQRYGWGFYGLAGYRNFHNWMDKAAGKGVRCDPMEDFDKLNQQKFRYENWIDPAGFDNSDGIMLNTGSLWKTKESDENNLPYAFRVYCDAGGANWTQRRFSDDMEKPAWFLQSGWHGPEQYWKAKPHVSWFATGYQRYQARKIMDWMKPFVDRKLNIGWMHPHGELSHEPWYDMHADYSKAAEKSWIGYLKKSGLSLAEISKMYGVNVPFTAWEQVPIPEFATFAGLNGRIKSLAGSWFIHLVKKGEKADFVNEPISGKEWTAINMPGGEGIFEFLKSDKNLKTVSWFRRSFEFVKPKTDKKIYLYWFPISHFLLHGDNPRHHEVYINGRFAGNIGRWGALDVGKLLKDGDNRIALKLNGPTWDGRIFLSHEAPSVFPYLGDAKNKLWMMWKDWQLDAKYTVWVEFLDGMRQVDPERQIKFMAPTKFGTSRWIKLAAEYGGWPHFTGEGMWFYPWYKRYAYLYGLPASSELAGPSDNLKKMFDGYRRVFMTGLNGHDPVFIAQTYTRDKELWKWWLDHRQLVSRLGTFDMDGPQVLIYRNDIFSIAYTTPEAYPKVGADRNPQSIWNWDLGRGTMQNLGQSFAYISDCGLNDGKMNPYKLMIDCGNEVVEKNAIEKIKEWVERGGTFISMPFTGRSTPVSPDSWPVEVLTGCKVGKLRTPGKGTVKILPDQNILKSFAGKTYPDQGRCLDWTGVNHDSLGVELKPGKDCKVIAVFENGTPAIVERKLGKGRVIVLGTAFWRSAQDRVGIWWGEKIERDFIKDLVAAAGHPAPPCESSNPLVWTQPYRSVNGLNSVFVVINWNGEKAAETTLTLRLPKKPSRITVYKIGKSEELPFKWKDGVAYVDLKMPAKEVQVISVDAYQAADSVNHWWDYQNKHWRELVKSKIDFSKYASGKWADPTLDLRFDACFTQLKPPADWTSANFDDSKWTNAPLDILSRWGADKKLNTYVRKTFEVPAEWARQGGKVYLCTGVWTRGKNFLSPGKIYFNGKKLSDNTQESYLRFDVTKLLNEDGKNVVAFEFEPAPIAVGFTGNTWLYHKAPPVKSVNLAGTWTVDAKGKVKDVTIPGTFRGSHPKLTFRVPEEWKGKYQVRLSMEGNRDCTLGGWINDFMVRRHHHNFGSSCDIDITSHLKFGKLNTIELMRSYEVHGKDRKEQNWKIDSIKLELYPIAP